MQIFRVFLTQNFVFGRFWPIFVLDMTKNFAYVKGDALPYHYKYEHMAVTTDCVIFTWEEDALKVLLVRRGADPYKGAWAFPGGFLQMKETAMEGALRELREETALEPSAIKELGVFSDVDRDPRERVITIAYYALVRPDAVAGGDDADEAAWFPTDSLPPLAFDHDRIFAAALERLRRDIHFEPVGFDLLDEEFSIPDLQRLYEAILGVKFDRRNFQRKILASGILEEAGAEDEEEFLSEACVEYGSPEPLMMACRMPMMEVEAPTTGAARPKRRRGRIASLFRLNRQKYEEMKEEGTKLEF